MDADKDFDFNIDNTVSHEKNSQNKNLNLPDLEKDSNGVTAEDHIFSSNPNSFVSDNVQFANQPDASKPAKLKKKKGIIFWLALIVMIASIIGLGIIFGGYLEGQKMYNDISDDVFHDKDTLNLADMNIDWNKLLEINPDTVGWVYCPGTQINYPIVHTNNNEKYLKTTFRGYQSYVSFGTIFADMNNLHDLSDQNVVTYGHNMNDGSMYAQIAKMRDQNELNNHKTIYFLTPRGNYRLTSFALCHVSANEPIVQTRFSSQDSMAAYVQDKINRAVARLEDDIPNANAITKLFSFSTCDNLQSDGRYLLFAYVSESTVDGVPGLE